MKITQLMKSKIFLPALIALFLTAPAMAQALDEAQIRAIVKEEIQNMLNSDGALDAAVEKGINNYIVKQRQAAEDAKAQQAAARAKNLRPVDEDRDHIAGSPDAAVTLIEYSDFECPYCKRFHPTVTKLMEDNKEVLRRVYRHFPLSFHNPGAEKEAQASECVAEIGGNDAFWEFSDEIYTRTKSNGKGFPLENLRPLAEEIGVDGDAFQECLDSNKMAARVAEDIENGKLVGVTGTPAAFLINKAGEVRFIAGALPAGQIQVLIDQLKK